ncbi:hypothetical protein PO124_15170 [Bacillus licheniformis]|nr:hypothetical protein [Bacillus licheniformis]
MLAEDDGIASTYTRKELVFCGKVCLQERMSFAFCAESDAIRACRRGA